MPVTGTRESIRCREGSGERLKLETYYRGSTLANHVFG